LRELTRMFKRRTRTATRRRRRRKLDCGTGVEEVASVPV
jgi:hypothetical protein